MSISIFYETTRYIYHCVMLEERVPRAKLINVKGSFATRGTFKHMRSLIIIYIQGAFKKCSSCLVSLESISYLDNSRSTVSYLRARCPFFSRDPSAFIRAALFARIRDDGLTTSPSRYKT